MNTHSEQNSLICRGHNIPVFYTQANDWVNYRLGAMTCIWYCTTQGAWGNPGVSGMCESQKTPSPNSYKILGLGGILETPSSNSLILWSTWPNRSEDWSHYPPILWVFPSAFIVRQLRKTAWRWKSWTKAEGKLLQDPIASLQSLLWKKDLI